MALNQWGKLPPSVVLITGASGGVGVASIHLALAMGHTVVGLSRSPEKAAKLKAIGALAIFNPNDTQWRRHLKAALGNRRVDLIIDQIGGEQFNDVLGTLGHFGKVSAVGRLAGPVPNFNTAALLFGRFRIGGVAVSDYSTTQSHAAWNEILELLNKIGARPIIDRVFPFDQLPAAFARLKDGPMGKVLLEIKK